ncbi:MULTISPECIES: RNA-binding S4 domain-containing protein [Corynebacterium]|uniref:RNA-binding S4 domain-containing protein n=3 Tax=Corynebacterium TaxID=1716 RepID=A0A7Y9ZVR7_9CORY|nr:MULTISPECIES: RNA-binding S4 domain-containing protein [Corynebacterium]EET77186.1 S4 domain protein [Corynebacterium tuberculostearicum SK141]EFQ79813.1 S4 domain protein [Corynebacterium pseudogenitalium ATCC 33035]MBK3427531.1 RNA-binding S4 domain-containing protein [Corynebacterium tuberculostearicum]MCG7453866.1 RNA-binding S4 domain-containing protein [Corynebacterium tuberculostearicum]MCG7468588.1 RNA-binding S4 domain-containing protein [Corynebacterium sp. ACRPE]
MPAPQPSGRPVRIDAWVWAVRMFKTRSAAATAVRAGHVKINGEAVKPSQQVVPGDRVRVWRNHHEHDLEVLATVAKRVGAPVARTCYTDHAPPPPPKEFLPSVPVRPRGAGRPTKKERRDMEKFRGGFR